MLGGVLRDGEGEDGSDDEQKMHRGKTFVQSRLTTG